MLGLGLGLSRSSFVAESLLLDAYSGAAAAYSLRKLSSTYTGSAIRVRESATNTEADIGFNADGTLNTTALLAHVGANNGFVTTWYDQSGNATNATQTTVASQPQIVSSGIVNLQNGKPCINFNGTSHVLLTSTYIVSLSQNSASVFAVSTQSSFGLGSRILNEVDVESPFSSNFLMGGDGFPVGSILWVNGSVFGTMLTGQSLSGFDYNGSTFQAHINGAASGAAGAATVNPEVLNTTSIGGAVLAAGGFMNGTIQEIITYKLNNSANRTAIESNINDYYNIY